MNIREQRRRRGWTQAELAKRLGTDHVTVSRWERGVAVPRPTTWRRLEDVFGAPRKPSGEVRFADDPTRRLRELDRMLREQRELKRRTQVADWTR